MTGTLATALAFARHGIATVPIWPVVERNGRLACGCGKTDCRSAGKHPIARLGKDGPLIAPNGILSASSDSGILKHWSQLAPDANIGASTATLVVLDVDTRHDGMESLAQLSRQGDMPPTWSVKTGSGGAHIYYRRPHGLDLHTPIIAENIIRTGGTPPFGPGIDIPAYVITPPSRHICGRSYEWDNHPSDYELAEAPGWIVERLTRAERKAADRAATDPAEWAKLTGGIITEYQDVHAAKVAGKLLRARSLDPAFAYGLFEGWNYRFCRPPLSDHELRQIFFRIKKREVERLNSGAVAGEVPT